MSSFDISPFLMMTNVVCGEMDGRIAGARRNERRVLTSSLNPFNFTDSLKKKSLTICFVGLPAHSGANLLHESYFEHSHIGRLRRPYARPSGAGGVKVVVLMFGQTD